MRKSSLLEINLGLGLVYGLSFKAVLGGEVMRNLLYIEILFG